MVFSSLELSKKRRSTSATRPRPSEVNKKNSLRAIGWSDDNFHDG